MTRDVARDARLDELLRALAAPEPPDAPERPVPPEILRAFALHARRSDATPTDAGPDDAAPIDAAATGHVGGRERGYERERGRRRIGLAAKSALCALVVSGGAMTAAAAADDLPRPAQSVAHAVLGPLGVPAPQTSTTPPAAPAPHVRTPRPESTPAHGVPQPGVSQTTHVSPGRTRTPTVGRGETKTPTPAASDSAAQPARSTGPGSGKGNGNGRTLGRGDGGKH